ncbi:hypothetical protein Cfor_03360 [Coptotermes formosanus]|uniref:Gustatory receptor n=1 Tax=Coptotermes formosanus TaxID=36987 RepID=A0A6L2Q5A0_COPFO|nr:hypothetical protein Cfor_03360 [Coptotermes formosanus]
MENAFSIKRELKYTYYLSKVLCLAPYSFSSNRSACEKSNNTNLWSHVMGLIWTLFMSVVMVIGLICGIYRYKNIGSSNPAIAVNSSLCFPMNFVNALLSFVVLFMKRYKFAELIEKLGEIDEGLCQIKLHKSARCQNYFLHFTFPICLLLAMFMCFDVLQVEERRYFIYCSLYRIAYLISIVLIIQFCHIVMCTQQRLFILRKEISSVLINKVAVAVSSTPKPILVEAIRKSELPSVMSTFSESVYPVHASRMKYQSASNNLLLPTKLLDLHKIIFYRLIYSNIYDAVELINSIYGFLLLLLFIRAAAGLVANIYYLASTTIYGAILLGVETWGSPAHIFSLACWISIFLSTVIAMTVTCQVVILESKKIGDIIQKLLLQQHVRCEAVEQLKLFSEQVTKNKIEFSALCLFKVDMSLLCTILASVTSYIIVLVQFK